MKKYILGLMLALCAGNVVALQYVDCQSPLSCRGRPIACKCPCDDGLSEYCAHSFMFTQPLYQNLVMRDSLLKYIIHDRKGPLRGSFNIIAAFQKSIKNESTAQYFLFGGKNELLVAGDEVFSDLILRDVRAEWLGLPADYSGRFSLCPEQKQLGFILSYNQDVQSCIDLDLIDGWWVSVDFPVVLVENELNLKQRDQANNISHNFPATVLEALNQHDWFYSRFQQCSSALKVAEINVKLGSNYSSDHFYLDYYSQMSIPTGNGQDPKYVFDAVSGNNGHFGFGVGIEIEVLLNRDPLDYTMSFFLECEELFLIRKTEMRSLNLLGRPWSRYLLLTPEQGPLGNTIPGVNILTRQVRSRPYNMVDFATGLRFNCCCIEAEAGYSIWGHSSEVLELRCQFPETYGIVGDSSSLTPADLPQGINTVTASRSTISQQVSNTQGSPYDLDLNGNPTFIPIRQADLDLRSGATPRSLNQKLSLSVGVAKEGHCANFIFGIGGFVEWPKYNTALQLAGAWAKVGASF